MNAIQKEANDLSKSENTQNEDSEEFKKFERGLRGILAIPKDEAKEIIRRTPYPKSGEEKKEKEAAKEKTRRK